MFACCMDCKREFDVDVNGGSVSVRVLSSFVDIGGRPVSVRVLSSFCRGFCVEAPFLFPILEEKPQ